MKTFDDITMEVKFSHWELEKYQAAHGDNGTYVRAKWNIVLLKGERRMEVPFNTGCRDLIGPRNIKQVLSRGFFPLKSRAPITNHDDQKKAERLIRAVLEGKATGHAEWMKTAVYHLSLKEPTKQDVLYCLCADAETLSSAMNFDDWAGELGMDPDSRKAEKMYRDTQDQTQRLRILLGGDSHLANLCEFVRSIDENGEEEARLLWQAKEEEAKSAGDFNTLEVRVHAARNEADKLLKAAALTTMQQCPILKECVAAMGSLFFTLSDGTPFRGKMKETDAFEVLVDKYKEMFGPTFGPWRLSRQWDGAITMETDW